MSYAFDLYKGQLAEVTEQRDRARTLAVALEQQLAAIELFASEIDSQALQVCGDVVAGSLRAILSYRAGD